MPSCKKCSEKSIVPKYINYEMDRDELQGHKSASSRILFDGENPSSVHLILHRTYIYVEKSKNRVLTDGTILFRLSPFKATEDDAQITSKLFDSSTPSIKTLLPHFFNDHFHD